MDYRIWAVLGLVLIILELHTLTFVLLFIGVAAMATAITAGIGLTPGTESQFALFSALSLASILILRERIRRKLAKSRVSPDFLGQQARVVKPIPPGGEGSIFYRGSEWIAYSKEPHIIMSGSMVEVVGSDGIRLCVRSARETDK